MENGAKKEDKRVKLFRNVTVTFLSCLSSVNVYEIKKKIIFRPNVPKITIIDFKAKIRPNKATDSW